MEGAATKGTARRIVRRRDAMLSSPSRAAPHHAGRRCRLESPLSRAAAAGREFPVGRRFVVRRWGLRAAAWLAGVVGLERRYTIMVTL